MRTSMIFAPTRFLSVIPMAAALSLLVVARVAMATVGEAKAVALQAIDEAVAPCSVEELHWPRRLKLPAGPVEASVEIAKPTTTQRGHALITLRVKGQVHRLAASLRLHCPPPLVRPGSRLTIYALHGSVRVSAPGVARQDGRRGDVIRVHNEVTGAALQARVIAEDQVEVVR